MSDAAERLYERVLVLRCQGGDPAALAKLIGQYSRQLRFYLNKMAGESAADDLLQEVWFEVFRKIARLRDPQAFPAWVYQIARAKAYSQLSRRRPIDAAELEVIACDDVEETWSVEDVELVRAALTQIELEHREVLLLRFIENMSYEQIAAVIDRPLGTVRSRLHYANTPCAMPLRNVHTDKDKPS